MGKPQYSKQQYNGERLIVTDLYLKHTRSNGKVVITHQWTTNAVRTFNKRQEEQAELMEKGKEFDIIDVATVEEYRAYKGYKGYTS